MSTLFTSYHIPKFVSFIVIVISKKTASIIAISIVHSKPDYYNSLSILVPNKYTQKYPELSCSCSHQSPENFLRHFVS